MLRTLRLQQKIWDNIFTEVTLGGGGASNYCLSYGTDTVQRLGFSLLLFQLMTLTETVKANDPCSIPPPISLWGIII